MATFADKISSLQQAAAGSPEYTEILPFFIELFRFLDARGGETGITFKLSGDGADVRMADGLPLIDPHSVQVDLPVCAAFLQGIIELLGRIGREGSTELARMEAALADGSIDPAAIFIGILERRRPVIDDTASSVGVPAPLLEYVFEIPLKTALELFAATLAPDAFPEWQESRCPVCGSRSVWRSLPEKRENATSGALPALSAGRSSGCSARFAAMKMWKSCHISWPETE